MSSSNDVVMSNASSSSSSSSSSSLKQPAKVYPFKLDTFQQEAVGYVEAGESVLVAAHTSAGKTAIAEYAIAKSLRDGQKVIYTSPIKALSNQKYRDLQEEFNDVGLMTGDMTINPNASCLIMTTEILRSMLYRGSEVMREIAWVIYDEVHYMRDKERGVVWEESIILLPHKIRFVFLSATIPNAKEFVSWISKMHHQPCHVVYTDYRPVPLQHFVFPAGSDGLHLVVDEKGRFREDNFQKAMSSLQGPAEGDERPAKKARKMTKNANSDLFKIVRLIMERELDPCIVFSFSKKDCETYALQMARLDFNSESEKELVEQVFLNAMEALSEDDKGLPQVQTILPLLKKGVGIHHGGLLPILKEVIEILFQEGLIKCLFATETFSIGINMPAKTVVFTSTRKFDGQDFRWITSGEYIQMSGRAGRRGKDDRGIVIQMLDEKMDPDVAKGMIYGASDPLFSSYRVNYNMVLNMLRVEDADPDNLLRSSFFQYQQEQAVPELEKEADELQREAMLIAVDDDEAVVSDYYGWCKMLKRCSFDIAQVLQRHEYCLPFLQPGRLLHLMSANEYVLNATTGADNSSSVSSSVSSLALRMAKESLKSGVWGIIVNTRKASKLTDQLLQKGNIVGIDDNDTINPEAYVIDMLLEINEPGTPPRMEVFQVALSVLHAISAARLTLPKDMSRIQSRASVLDKLNEVRRRFESDGIPLLDPIKDMSINDETFRSLTEKANDCKKRIESSTFHCLDDKDTRLNAYEVRVRLLEEARALRSKCKESQTISMREDLRRMKRVLRRQGYISTEGVLGTKGRFSCELSTGDELVLTDMIFDGVFNDLSVEQTVALLSCFVHKEGGSKDNNDKIKVKADMEGPFQKLQTAARTIARISIDAKMNVIEEDYVKSFNPGLIDATYAWAAGSRFVDICKLTDIFEGSIIRSIRRLEELLRQLGSASLAIGNKELQALFEDGAKRIRRGVVFAASLYL